MTKVEEFLEKELEAEMAAQSPNLNKIKEIAYLLGSLSKEKRELPNVITGLQKIADDMTRKNEWKYPPSPLFLLWQ